MSRVPPACFAFSAVCFVVSAVGSFASGDPASGVMFAALVVVFGLLAVLWCWGVR